MNPVAGFRECLRPRQESQPGPIVRVMYIVRRFVIVALISLVVVQTAAAQLTADKFKSSVNKQVAAPIGTLGSEGKWKTLCVCNSVDAVGALETNTSGIPRLGVACIVPNFNPDGSLGSTSPCLDWTLLNK